MVSITVFYLRHFLNLIKPSGLPTMSATAQTDRQRGGRFSHPSPQWYSPPLSVRFGPDPIGGHCCSSHTGRHTGENPCGLPLTFPPTDLSGLEHVDWNSWLTTRRGKLPRDYADENSYLIFGPDTPTTNPYKLSATPDVLYIKITNKLSRSVYLHSCSVLSSGHLLVLIDTAFRSSFHHPPDSPAVRRTDWANFHSLRRLNCVRSGIAQRDGNRHQR